ncbi:MAG: histidine phosphatase family protein [Chordicoccus sp.]
MELYILRHGTTEWNEKHLLQGRSDIPLDESGRRLAAEVGEELSRRHITFDRCYSSPLKRAYETAELALGKKKLSEEKYPDQDRAEKTEDRTACLAASKNASVPIETDPRIEEMCFGDYEGMNCSKNSPDTDPRVLEALSFDIDNYKAPRNGESMEQLLGRTHEFYEDVIHDPENKGKRILVSTHGGAGRALMHSVWGGDFWHGCVPPNCSICIVSVDDETGAVKDVKQDVVLYKEKVLDFYG